MRAALTAGLASLALASSGAAQTLPSWSAGARLTDTGAGPVDPAFWLGARFGLRRSGFDLQASAAGGRGWRGRLGGEASLAAALDRELAGRLRLIGSVRGGAEHPIGGRETAGELAGRLGLGHAIGPLMIRAGGLLAGQSALARGAFAGGFVSAAVGLGPVTLTGDLGQMALVSGSLASPAVASEALAPDDSMAAGGTRARRLSHAMIGARVGHGLLEVYTNLLSRSRLTLGETVGWEAGVAVGPVAGVRLRVSGGRMPAPQTFYLPYRKQLAVGVEILGRRGDGRSDARTGGIGFDVLIGSAGTPTRIVVHHPTAIRVEVAGDFSGWDPVFLRAMSPGVFEAAIPLDPGPHQINVRFDGGRWEVPPGLGSTPDEFGGRAGLIVVR